MHLVSADVSAAWSGMPRVSTSSHPTTSAADAQVDAAVSRLVGLFAKQVARELVIDASEIQETCHATKDPQKD